MSNWNGHNEAVQRAMVKLAEGDQSSYDTLYDALNREFIKYYENLAEDSPLKAYIDYFGRPEIDIIQDSSEEPVLYGTLLGSVECTYGSKIVKGSTVRVTMLSEIGDIGVTTNLDALRGYNARVGLNALENYRTTEDS